MSKKTKKEKKCCGKCNCSKNKSVSSFQTDWDGFLDDIETEEEDENVEEEEVDEDYGEDDLDEYEKDRWESKIVSLIKTGFFDKNVWMTTSQAAKWYGVNDRTIRRWIENGKIISYDLGEFQSKYIVEVDLNSRFME